MKHRARLSFTVSLEMDIEAESGFQAWNLAKEHENLILTQEWQCDKANPAISKIAETLFMSKIDMKMTDEQIQDAKAGIKLG